MSKVKTREKVILFTCNWHAFNSLEAVGKERSSYSVDLVPIRLPCLGRITPGIILKAFERGAGGVLLLGCPENHCQFQGGNQEALKVVEETRSLLKLLGYGENRLGYQLLPAESGGECLKVLNEFMSKVQNGRDKT
jgi:F420-non-reducing hydrogenase iron-sulfur subunit